MFQNLSCHVCLCHKRWNSCETFFYKKYGGYEGGDNIGRLPCMKLLIHFTHQDDYQPLHREMFKLENMNINQPGEQWWHDGDIFNEIFI